MKTYHVTGTVTFRVTAELYAIDKEDARELAEDALHDAPLSGSCIAANVTSIDEE